MIKRCAKYLQLLLIGVICGCGVGSNDLNNYKPKARDYSIEKDNEEVQRAQNHDTSYADLFIDEDSAKSNDCLISSEQTMTIEEKEARDRAFNIIGQFRSELKITVDEDNKNYFQLLAGEKYIYPLKFSDGEGRNVISIHFEKEEERALENNGYCITVCVSQKVSIWDGMSKTHLGTIYATVHKIGEEMQTEGVFQIDDYSIVDSRIYDIMENSYSNQSFDTKYCHLTNYSEKNNTIDIDEGVLISHNTGGQCVENTDGVFDQYQVSPNVLIIVHPFRQIEYAEITSKAFETDLDTEINIIKDSVDDKNDAYYPGFVVKLKDGIVVEIYEVGTV